jgi:hypothetical protein
MTTGARLPAYPNYQPYPVRPGQSVFSYPRYQAPLTGYIGPQTAYRPNYSTSSGYSAYQPQLLSVLKQQLAGTVINTSRVPVTLQQLKGKKDGEAVHATSYSVIHPVGISTLDGALQRTGDLVAYMPQALSNVVSTSTRGAFYSAAGSTALVGVCIGVGKLLGKMKGLSLGYVIGGLAGAGLLGGMLGGAIGCLKATFETLRDLKDILLGNN